MGMALFLFGRLGDRNSSFLIKKHNSGDRIAHFLVGSRTWVTDMALVIQCSRNWGIPLAFLKWQTFR